MDAAEEALVYGSPIVREQSASVVQIEHGRLVPLVVVLALSAGLAIGLSTTALVRSGDAERESRMLEYYLLELDAKAIAAGIKQPDEAISKKLEGERKQ